ncbi:MAG: type II secretion system protein GspG [Pyrinomonadaceae bacterium]
MNAGTIRTALLLSVLACCVVVLTCVDARADLSASQARRAMTHIPGFELKSGAVRVKSISASSASTAEVSAEIQTVFKFETDKQGRWRVAEIRTGPERWEDIDLIASALGMQAAKGDCSAPDPRVRGKVTGDPNGPSVKRARCLLGSLLGIEIPSDAIRIQEVDSMPIPLASQPSATVIAWVRVDARLTSDKRGWQVAELQTGNRGWVKLEPLVAAVNEQKQKVARAELDLIARALEKFRKDRGFYVVSDKHAVAIDFLSPRYLARVIRIDPWHQPYKYLGERDHFTLRSTGPDGKVDTPDDILLRESR